MSLDALRTEIRAVRASVVDDDVGAERRNVSSFLEHVGPTGTVVGADGLPWTRVPGLRTLLFTDIEGSTRMWEEQPEAMSAALRRHEVLLRAAIEGAGGYVFKTVGDSFCAAFSTASAGVDAALAAQRALLAEEWPSALGRLRVRMGLHTGYCEERDGDFFGPTVNRAARLEATAWGGQTVLSRATVEALGSGIPGGVTLRDLGSHRLKDLGRPEQVFQLEADGLASDHPPLRSLNNPELGNNLPEQISTFVGREVEMATVGALVSESRLVTLVGSGGAGKTRLALQVAADLVDQRGDGVWLVELAALTEADLLPGAVAAAIAVREEPGRPTIGTLTDALRDKSLLIVLDNCEHLLDSCADLTDRILRACPGVHFLVTSRQPLGINGERVFRVPSLSLPTEQSAPYAIDAVMQSEAIRLFVDRATSHEFAFELDDTNVEAAVSICRRLDGIPLAIELAAARLRTLSAADIERRLDNRFRLLTGGSRVALPRQQTLRALVDWSYDLLGSPERHLLCRLSVFAGGWTLEAAEAVCATDELPDFEVLELLASLVDKSLVQTDSDGAGVRYRLPETIRDYAAGKLDELRPEDVDALRELHGQWFLRLAEAAAGHDRGADQADWFVVLDHEQSNLRAALAHFLEPDAPPHAAARLSVALRGYWRTRGQYREGVRALELALDRREMEQPSPLRARGLIALGYLQARLGDHAAACDRLEAGLAAARSCDDVGLVADALCELAWAAFRKGEKAEALALAEEGVRMAHASRDPNRVAQALQARGTFCDATAPARARTDYAEALAFYREVGNRREVAALLNNLALSELDAGNLSGSHDHLLEAIVIASDLGDNGLLPYLRYAIGLVEILQGDHGAALASFTDTLVAARSAGDRSLVAYAILGLAFCAAESGNDHRAATLQGVACGMFDELGEQIEPLEAYLLDLENSRLESALGDEVFRSELSAGRSLPATDAMGLALQIDP